MEGPLNRQREPLPTRVETLPEPPTAYANALDAVLAALDEGPDRGPLVDSLARRLLDGHVRLLMAWNEAINLTAIRDPAAIARLHVADSLAGALILREAPPGTILDLGSGGGFPGLPLAATLPAAHITLLDSVGKKATFLETVVDALGLEARVDVSSVRAEALARGPRRWDVVTVRAVGSLADLIELALPILRPGGRLLAWKRGDLAAEFRGAGRAATALGGSIPAFVPHPPRLAVAAQLEGHGIVIVRKNGPTPADYPRDPASRARRPW